MGMPPSYSSIYLIAAQLHNHQKWCLQRRCLFWTISHLPNDVSPTNEWYLLSNYMNHWYLNAKDLNLAPFLLISKRHSPVLRNSSTAWCDLSSFVCCIRIHPMPSVLQSVLSKVVLLRSNLDNTGEYVTLFSICWIILSMMASKPSMELSSYQIVLVIFLIT